MNQTIKVRMLDRMATMVERAAEMRHESPVPKEKILKALEAVGNGTAVVEKYPGGAPSLKGIYDLAANF